MRGIFWFCTLLVILVFGKAHAQIGDGGAGWANNLYLAQILAENIKHYQQLQTVIGQGKSSDQYLRYINQGIDNSIGLLRVLPIKDEKILGELLTYRNALGAIQNVYGVIPKSQDQAIHTLHDQTVAESLKMVNTIQEYGLAQEENAMKISIQSQNASPKGAARMNTETNAQILHTLAQLLRINGQILKLQSEQVAMSNKMGKDSASNFNKVKSDMKSNLTGFKGNFNLPKF